MRRWAIVPTVSRPQALGRGPDAPPASMTSTNAASGVGDISRTPATRFVLGSVSAIWYLCVCPTQGHRCGQTPYRHDPRMRCGRAIGRSPHIRRGARAHAHPTRYRNLHRQDAAAAREPCPRRVRSPASRQGLRGSTRGHERRGDARVERGRSAVWRLRRARALLTGTLEGRRGTSRDAAQWDDVAGEHAD